MSKKAKTTAKAKTTSKSKAKAAPASDPDRVPLAQAMKPAAKAGKGKVTKRAAATPANAKGKANPEKAKRNGGLDAAAQVLKDAGEPMRCQAIVDAALDRGLWKTGGKTPAATISAAIGREIANRGADARFKKTAPGMFAFNG